MPAVAELCCLVTPAFTRSVKRVYGREVSHLRPSHRRARQCDGCIGNIAAPDTVGSTVFEVQYVSWPYSFESRLSCVLQL